MKAALVFYMFTATIFFCACALCLCFGGCVWHDMEGNWYAASPIVNEDYDGPQVQLNPHTHYR